MGIEDDVTDLMVLVDQYGELCEWHGARPGDDETGQLESSKAKLRDTLRYRLALEIDTLSPAIAQLQAGDSDGALKMLLKRMESSFGPNA